MKIGDVISIDIDSNHRQIIDIKQGHFVNTFILQSIIHPDQIINVEGHNIRDENFKVITKEQIDTWLDWVEEYYITNDWKVTWNKAEVLNRLYGESR